MTIIAWDGKTLAADTAASEGDRKFRFKGKLRRMKNGSIAGMAGDVTACIELMDWLDDEEETAAPKIKGEAEVMLVDKSGQVYLYDSAGVPVKVDEAISAIGSGADIAIGALAAGATAKRAVEIAIEREKGCGFDCVTMTHEA